MSSNRQPRHGEQFDDSFHRNVHLAFLGQAVRLGVRVSGTRNLPMGFIVAPFGDSKYEPQTGTTMECLGRA